jgi:hypothetical protein
MTRNANTAPEDPTSLRLPSAFRMWVNNNWVKNTEERLIYGQKPYTITEYWNTVKWWLKSQYRQQQKKAQDGRRR